jgi:formylmethanofuran dehydrogenase subunit E-like metal-binding protein
MYRSGNYVAPQGSSGYFSRANWGDRTVSGEDNKPVFVQTTTNAVKVVRKISDELWDKIIAAAKSMARGRKPAVQPEIVETISSDDEDWELRDDDRSLSKNKHKHATTKKAEEEDQEMGEPDGSHGTMEDVPEAPAAMVSN